MPTSAARQASKRLAVLLVGAILTSSSVSNRYNGDGSLDSSFGDGGKTTLMQHRNINTEEWSRMAIDSLFEREVLPDWREFAQALQRNVNLASETIQICERHPNKASAALARTLAEHFHAELTLRR